MHLMQLWRTQLATLLLNPGIEQRSTAWFEARTELTTASDAFAAIGGRNGATKAFLVKKAGDPKEQSPFPVNIPSLKWGTMFEPVAMAVYTKRMGVVVYEFGLLRHPEISHIGASPDGISETGVMLEIKCPYSRVIDGTVSPTYMAQIQCQLDVCCLDDCDFLQCKFEETLVGQDTSTEWDGRERGVLVEFWDDVLKTYMYRYCPEMGSDSAADVDARERWAADALKDLDPRFEGIIRRYRLQCLDIVRVHKNPQFIQAMRDSMAVTWQRVLRYRGDRQAFTTEVLNVGRKPSLKRKSDIQD